MHAGPFSNKLLLINSKMMLTSQ